MALNTKRIAQTNAGSEKLVYSFHTVVTKMRVNTANAKAQQEEAWKAVAEVQEQQTRVSNELLQTKKVLEEEQKMQKQLA